MARFPKRSQWLCATASGANQPATMETVVASPATIFGEFAAEQEMSDAAPRTTHRLNDNLEQKYFLSVTSALLEWVRMFCQPRNEG